MSSFFVFYIFATVFILVQCQEFNHVEEVDYHVSHEIKQCKKPDIIANRKKAALAPRERHVILKPESGYEFFPRTVTVKRCNGQCPDRWSPMPTKNETKLFTVHLHKKGEAVPLRCVSVEVLEHTSCMCMCMKTEKSCNEHTQMWDPSNCDCTCKSRETEKRTCEDRKEMVWHDEDCGCRCTDKIMRCPSGLIWDKELCNCVTEIRRRVMMED